MRCIGAGLMVLILVGCGGGTDPPRSAASLDELALDVCPLLWEWQLGVGERINHMSRSATTEQDPTQRQALYFTTFADLGAELDELSAAVADLPATRHTATMVAEIAAGVAVARGELADLIATVESTPAAEEPPGRQRVPSFFGEFEKLIDVVKPEIAGYGDEALTTAFAAVPACQFGVKDVDDGVARADE